MIRNNIVYFVESKRTRYIKIGFTEKFKFRLAQLRSAEKHQIRVLALVCGDRVAEAFFHELFSDHRAYGEWFKPHHDIKKAISLINLTGSFPGMPADRGEKTSWCSPEKIKNIASLLGHNKTQLNAAIGAKTSVNPCISAGQMARIIIYGYSRGLQFEVKDFYENAA